MTGGKPDIAALRQAAEAAVRSRSLRAVADDIGMSWSGLRSFLDGTQPQALTIAKLVAWHARGRGRVTSAATQADLYAAAEVMADYIDGARSPEGKERRVAAALQALADRLGTDGARALRGFLK